MRCCSLVRLWALVRCALGVPFGPAHWAPGLWGGGAGAGYVFGCGGGVAVCPLRCLLSRLSGSLEARSNWDVRAGVGAPPPGAPVSPNLSFRTAGLWPHASVAGMAGNWASALGAAVGHGLRSSSALRVGGGMGKAWVWPCCRCVPSPHPARLVSLCRYSCLGGCLRCCGGRGRVSHPGICAAVYGACVAPGVEAGCPFGVLRVGAAGRGPGG